MIQQTTVGGNPMPLPLFLVFVALSAAAALFFIFSRNAPLKRKLFPVWIFLGGFFFLLVLWYVLHGTPPLFYAFAAFVIISSWLNMRRIRFCDGCGRTVTPRRPGGLPPNCPSCGAKL